MLIYVGPLNSVIFFDPIAVELEDGGGYGGRIAGIDIDSIELAKYGECPIGAHGAPECEVPLSFRESRNVGVSEDGEVAFA